MAINTRLKGAMIDRKKNEIIEKYNEGAEINMLAAEYDIATDTLCRRLKKWGIKVKKGDYHKNRKDPKHWYRKFSKTFLANRAAITKSNTKYIKYVRTVNGPGDQVLVRNILNKALK